MSFWVIFLITKIYRSDFDFRQDMIVKTMLVASPHLVHAYRMCRPGQPPTTGSVCFESKFKFAWSSSCSSWLKLMCMKILTSFSRKHAAIIIENIFNYSTFQDVTHPIVKSNILKRRVIKNVFNYSGCMFFTETNVVFKKLWPRNRFHRWMLCVNVGVAGYSSSKGA